MKKITLIIVASFISINIQAKNLTEGGLTLLQSPGARSSALANAFSAGTNDIEAFSFNPASLATLTQSHASFSYEKGFSDDAFGQLQLGLPRGNTSLGFMIGFYNGGTIDVGAAGQEQSITTQRDLLLGMGWARHWGRASIGVAGKYLSSELAETESATAMAADLGGQYKANSRLNIGLAIQNVGTKLKYQDVGDDLPRVARMGMAYKLHTRLAPAQLLLDIPYYMNQRDIVPAVGLETFLSGLIVRGGYKHKTDGGEFSMGTGFAFGQTNLDYAFGLVNSGVASHRVSFSMKFPALETKPIHVVIPPVIETPAPAAVEPVITEPEQTELQKDVVKIAPEMKGMSDESIKLFLRGMRFKLGDLDKTRAEWIKLYEKYRTEIEK